MKAKKKAKKKKLARKITTKKITKNPPSRKASARRRKKLVKKPRKVLVKKFRRKKLKKVVKRRAKRKKKNVFLSRKKPVKIKTVTRRAQAPDSFAPGSFFKAKIKVVGVGGGGGSIVSEIGRALHKATFVVADTDMRAFKKKPGIKNFLFGQELTHGLGTGVNPDLGRQAAESEKERISQLFLDQDIVIFIASLGGGLGSSATQVFAKACENFNGITLGIFTLPFKFEGKNKYKIALKSLRELRKVLNVSITIPNERIFKVIDANTAITDAFSIVNKSLIESLESLIDLIYNPGIINIDFADLRAILGGKGNLAFLNTAEAQGKDRAEIVAQKILHNLLYQSNNFVAQKILFNIEGSGNLSMFEVNKISQAISEQNPKSKIIFGISKNNSLKNKIKTTLLMTGAGQGVEAAPVVPEVTTKIVKAPLVKKAKASVRRKIARKSPANRLAGKKARRAKTKPAPGKGFREPKERVPFADVLPVFDNVAFENSLAQGAAKKLDIIEASTRPKKPIRRTALEVKKAEEVEGNKQSSQEKEWEIPAFLRIKK